MRSPLHVAAEHLQAAMNHAFRGDEGAARRARAEADLELHMAVAAGDLEALLRDGRQLDPAAAGMLRLRLPLVWTVPERVRTALVELYEDEDPWFARPPSFEPASAFWAGAKVDWLDLAIEALLHACHGATLRAVGGSSTEDTVAHHAEHLRAEAALVGASAISGRRARLRADERWWLDHALTMFSAESAARAAS